MLTSKNRCKKCGRFDNKNHKCPDKNPMKGKKRKRGDGNWKGGRIKVNGYIWINAPEHPYRNSSNYVAEHRLIMEEYFKRFLNPWEIIHHINEIRDDNRIDNLQLLQNLGEHNRIHKTKQMKGELL